MNETNDQQIISYVLGVALDGHRVAFLRKPERSELSVIKGTLNSSETPRAAIVREFRDQTRYRTCQRSGRISRKLSFLNPRSVA